MRTLQVGFLLFFICLFVQQSPAEKPKIRVGIVGAGLGGTSAAYWLNQYLKDSVDITIYEEGEVGGRLRNVKVEDHEYECGGSAILETNLYMVRFTEELGLNRLRENMRFLSFILTNDGSETLFSTTSKYTPQTLSFLWRYGYDAYRMTKLIKLGASFDKIYDFQDAGRTFDTVEEFLKALDEDYYKATRVSLRKFLYDKGFSKLYVDELAQMATLANYEQSADTMNGLPGLFSQVSVNQPLWHVEGGNTMVPKQMLKYVMEKYGVHFVKAHVKSVKEGSKDDEHENIRITYEGKNKEVKHADYDYVIVALPVHRDTKDFVIKSNTKHNPNDYPMHEVHANFVKAKISADKYNLTQEQADELSAIFYCDASLPYRSVMQPKNVNIQPINPIHFGVFTKEKIHGKDYKNIFGNDDTEVLADVGWLAYPAYEYPQKIPPMKLGKNIFYPNAVEWAGSFMEMIIVSARNTAMLLAKEQGVNVKKDYRHSEF